MNGNFRWHYVKDGAYPRIKGKCREALVIVKQFLPKNPDDETLCETFTSCYYTDENKFVSTLYGCETHGVVAWCYIRDVCSQLDNKG